MNDGEAPRMPERRVLLKAGGTVLMSAWLLGGCSHSQGVDDPLRGPDRPTPHARFLTDAERRTLRALVDRLIPAGLEPGAAAAHAEDAIDALLAAFLTDPPLIYAGGPYSDRAGAARNDLARFIPLDEYETLAWRLVIEGSQGRPEREFNGPVIGLQAIYREGLAHLDARAAELATGVLPAALGEILRERLADTPLSDVLDLVNALTGTETFADLPALLRNVIVFDDSDAKVRALVDVAFLDTLDGTYGAPEYGGNRDLVGWTSTEWPGDVQPRGWTAEQVSHRDPPGPFDALLPPPYGGGDAPRGSGAAAPLVIPAGESLTAAILDAQGSLAALRRRLDVAARVRPEWIWRAHHG
ncbi:gluconate 2-dehydrogenase subunit 3 family protein [Sinimarinibacterium thermocellulolyticum]|uniref:Gluconate 2-dehydrogenase subunit 3 family protein n=1 Tax=Sinimarinibacterium thermocellulolyticum TaxID=3170016 RepID=A0ABV2A9B9_9GAMM